MDQNLEKIKLDYLSKIDNVTTDTELENLRIEIFGRNGKINQLFSEIRNVAPENRKQFGADLNQLKTELEEKLKNINIQKTDKVTSKKSTSKIFTLPKLDIFTQSPKLNDN
jgi:phenylalanyl-tRNA synthetase alpha chain